MVDRRCVIESVIPNVKMEREPFPMVLLGGQGITTIFPPYKKGSLPDKEFFSGEIDVVIKYGHPDGDYSRIMTRKMMFSSALVKRPTSPGLFPVLPVISAQIPLPIGSREMERDEPYHGS